MHKKMRGRKKNEKALNEKVGLSGTGPNPWRVNPIGRMREWEKIEPFSWKCERASIPFSDTR